MRTIEDECSSALSSAEDQADMLHTIKQARDDVISWKAHQLRSVHQAQAEHSVLAKLDSLGAVSPGLGNEIYAPKISRGTIRLVCEARIAMAH